MARIRHAIVVGKGNSLSGGRKIEPFRGFVSRRGRRTKAGARCSVRELDFVFPGGRLSENSFLATGFTSPVNLMLVNFDPLQYWRFNE
jgi:hypothetical protein